MNALGFQHRLVRSVFVLFSSVLSLADVQHLRVGGQGLCGDTFAQGAHIVLEEEALHHVSQAGVSVIFAVSQVSKFQTCRHTV